MRLDKRVLEDAGTAVLQRSKAVAGNGRIATTVSGVNVSALARVVWHGVLGTELSQSAGVYAESRKGREVEARTHAGAANFYEVVTTERVSRHA